MKDVTTRMSARDVDTMLVSRLLPLADVVCLKYQRPSDAARIAGCLESWFANLRVMPVSVQPDVIVISEGDDDDLIRDSIFSALSESSRKMASTLQVVHIGSERKHSSGDRVLSFQQHLTAAVKEPRERKRKARLMFNAEHLTCLLHAAVMSVALDIPFDLVKASRLPDSEHPEIENLSVHLLNLAHQIELDEQGIRFLTSTIASSLAFDHYVPGMHGRQFLNRPPPEF
jgi:hypothetical protein